MTNRQQWTLIATLIGTAVFGVAFAIKLRPQTGLLGPGSRAPHFQAVDLRTGKTVTLGDYRGKVLLINIWATWCPPCRHEMPSMERLHRKLAGTDLRILAVSVDIEGADLVKDFVREFGLTFDVLHDPTTEIQRIYQAPRVPESFIVDRDGVIVKRVMGAATWDSDVNEALIRGLLDAR